MSMTETLTEQLWAYQPSCEQEAADRAMMLTWLNLCPNGIFTRENATAHFTASGLIFNPELNKVLLVHHTIYNAWTWTGGHADGERDLLHVALREAREETGIREVRPLREDIATLDVLPVFGHVKAGVYISAHLHLSVGYALVADEDQPLTVCAGENTDVRWADLPEVERLTATEPHMQPVYRKVMEFVKRLQP